MLLLINELMSSLQDIFTKQTYFIISQFYHLLVPLNLHTQHLLAYHLLELSL